MKTHGLIAGTVLICEDHYCASCSRSLCFSRARSHRRYRKVPALRLFVPPRSATMMKGADVIYLVQLLDHT